MWSSICGPGSLPCNIDTREDTYIFCKTSTGRISMPKKILACSLAVLWLTTLVTVPAVAEDELVLEKEPEEKKKEEGWDFLLKPGASVSLSDNRSVIGQPEGLTMTLGASLEGRAALRSGPHEWRSTLGITELFSHTPQLDEFVKTTDIFKFESIYLFHLIDWLGPFAKLNIDTFLFEGFDVRSEAVTWLTPDGPFSGYHLRLTDGFEPLTLKETAGFFAKPLEDKKLNVEGRLGFGGVHVFADGWSLKDDGATPGIEVIEIKSYNQAGGVIEATTWGSLYATKISYKLGAEVMVPFIYDLDEGDDRGIVDLINVEFMATLTFKVFDWLSVDYTLRILRQPQLLDDWQIQNNLLLTASYAFFQPEEEEKE